MSLCAGYFGQAIRFNREMVHDFDEHYCVRVGISPADSMLQTAIDKIGFQICIYSKKAFSYPYFMKDAQGNILMILGFLRQEIHLSDSNEPDEIFNRAVREGPGFLEKQEGQFVAVFVEGKTKTVHVINDRFASRPFYLFQKEGEILYSSDLFSLFKLANMIPKLDALGWLQIFQLHHTLGARTNFDGVVRLQPGTHLTISSAGIQEQQYWRLRHEPDHNLDPGPFADEVFEAFSESVSWRAKRAPKSLLALSGGLDSRLVAGCLPEDIDATAFTFFRPSGAALDKQEALSASQVAEQLNLVHQLQAFEPGEYSRVAKAAVDLTNGLVPLQHPSKTMQYINKLGIESQYLLGGGPGGVLAGGPVKGHLDYLDPGRKEEMIEDFCEGRRISRANLTMIFSDDFLDEFYQQFNHSLAKSFSSLSGPTAAQQLTAWSMVFRQPAFTFTTPFHNHPLFEEGIPHLGYRYSDLMLKLPAEWIFSKNFYGYMIYRCLPRLRTILYANTGKPLSGKLDEFDYHSLRPSTLKRKWQAQMRIAKEEVKELGRKWVPVGLRPRREFSADSLLFLHDKEFLKAIEEMLDLPKLDEVVDRKRSRKFLQNFRDRRFESPQLLGALATLCLSAKLSQ